MTNGLLNLPTSVCCLLLLLALISCSGNIKRNGLTSTVKQNFSVSPRLEEIFAQSLTHLDEHEYIEAISLLETFTQSEKRLTAPYVNLGIAYSRTGDTRMAEKNFISALRINAGHPVANNEIALLYRRSGRFDAARTAYLNALTMHPDYLPARKNLGILCEIYLHDLECAIEQFRAYLQYNPDDETVTTWIQMLEQRQPNQQ